MTNGEWIMSLTDVIIGDRSEEGWIEAVINADWWDAERTDHYQQGWDDAVKEMKRLVREEMVNFKTEPIPHDDCIETENDYLEARCQNCANGGSYKCSKCDGEMYFKDEPQTEREDE